MRLGVPRRQVNDVVAAVRLGLVRAGVGLAEAAEDLAPAPAAVQAVRGVDGVAGLVAQDAHALPSRAAFDFEHLLTLEFSQPFVREVKRVGDTRDAVGRKPLAGEPYVRLVPDAASLQLVMELFGMCGQRRPIES